MPKNMKTGATQQVTSQTFERKEAEVRSIPPRLRHLAVAVALFVLTVCVYSNSFRSGFSLDNGPLILQDPRVQAVTSENVSLIVSHSAWWVPPEKGLYRPFTTLTYLFNYAVLGNADQPAGYHYINLLIHFSNVLLCYALALTVLRKFWPSFFVAALWAVHPVLTESVANIIGRADLLAAFGVLAGLMAYIKSRESTGVRRIRWLIGVTAATAIGIFSKESAIAILGLILLYEIIWWKDRTQLRNLI